MILDVDWDAKLRVKQTKQTRQSNWNSFRAKRNQKQSEEVKRGTIKNNTQDEQENKVLYKDSRNEDKYKQCN